MKSSADIGLVAAAITAALGTPGDEAWHAAGDAIEALDAAGRLAPTPDRSFECDECGLVCLGPLCTRCRRAEDGHQREPLDNEAFAALCATGYADDEAEF